MTESAQYSGVGGSQTVSVRLDLMPSDMFGVKIVTSAKLF